MSAREQRRLAAILAADVVGFSRMMEADEKKTLTELASARKEVLELAVADHSGRIVKTTGDGFLAEFGSAVDAVRCAINVQEAMALRNAGVVFRIGINLGDVVVDGDDIFGDGVNVAARLEALAPPGGVAISGNVAEQITGRIATRFSDVGEKRVKNITRPIRVWQWTPEKALIGVVQASAEAKNAGSGKNPVVVVLPFGTVARDSEIDELREGLADSLTAALSRRRGAEVLARGTIAGLGGTVRDLSAVRTATGADYVLTGVIRRSGTRLRVSAEMVETGSSAQIWANRYDEEWGDIFGLEDSLTERIATAVRSAMNANEGRRFGDASISAATNAERRAKAAQHFYSFTLAGTAAARRLLDEALASDPDDAMALSMQAFATILNSFFEIHPIGKEDSRRAVKMAERAVELDRTSDYAYETRGLLALHLRGDCQAALADARHALALNPQYALAIQLEGEALIYCGQPQEGIAPVGKAITFDLRDPTNFYRHFIVAVGQFILGGYDDALVEIDRAVQGAIDMPRFDLLRAAILDKVGRQQEARSLIAQILARWPDATVRSVQKLPFQRIEDLDRYLDALRGTGLPDE